VSPLRLGVLGAGSIGCYVGGRLAGQGEDVRLLGRERLKQEIAEHGLTVVDLAGRSRQAPGLQVETDEASLSDRDVVLVCVKSGDTEATARSVASVLAQVALVVSFQNGVRNPDVLRQNLSQGVLGGIVGFNVVSRGAGVFRRGTSGPLVLEASADPRAAALAAALQGAGFEVERVQDLQRVQWSKLIINLNNAVSALSNAPTRELVLSAGYRRVLAALIEEALAVLGASGIRPARLGPLPVAVFPRLLRLPTWLFRVLARAQLAIDPSARSSMWEDLARGRVTEVEFLNGEIVRLAASAGVGAPLNRRVVALVHDAECAAKGSPGLSAEALWTAMH
jgi:2-dehydropantoate 2-reductase